MGYGTLCAEANCLARPVAGMSKTLYFFLQDGATGEAGVLPAKSRIRLSAICNAGAAPSLAGAENLTAVDLSHNQLSGALPALPPGVLTADLSYNSFTSGVPASYGGGWTSTSLDMSHSATMCRFSSQLPCSSQGSRHSGRFRWTIHLDRLSFSLHQPLLLQPRLLPQAYAEPVGLVPLGHWQGVVE